MGKSIRWRLQGWYALVLLTVVVGFAALLYYRARAAHYQELDAALESAAHYLDVNLRAFPDKEFAGFFPPEPPWPKEGPDEDWPEFIGKDWKGKKGKKGPPKGPQHRQKLLASLTLPGRDALPGAEGGRGATYFAVWRPDGSLLKASGLPEGAAIPDKLSPLAEVRWRGEYREAVMMGPNQARILVGRSVAKDEADLRAFAWQLAGVGAFVLGVGLAGGWVISSRILRPVAAIAGTASAISAASLSRRIDPDTVDRELADLARVLNAMFERLEGAFERQARFTADASHELRTPLAIIRTNAELALTRPRPAEEYRETIETCLRAAGRMTALVEGLLTLARADAGKLDFVRQSVDLAQLVEESVTLFRPLAAAREVTLFAMLGTAGVRGDPVRLAQVVTNLLSNAVHYNKSGGEIEVRLSPVGSDAVLSVRDTGCGIPEADRPHLFERFYRVDKARSRMSGGNGLGLAICKSIVEAHGGTIGFHTAVGRGTTFWVRLPCGTGP